MADKLRFYTTEQISEHLSKTPEGFLLCQDVPVTRIGEFIYKQGEVPVQADSSGLIKIQRDESEVFRPETIASAESKPVTIDHPDEVVTPENWSKYAVGHIQNVRRGEGDEKDLLIADLLITTEKAIELVESGLREISLGYDAEYETINDKEGLGRQKEIVINHCALVQHGRAGSRCAIADRACTGCGQCTCKDKTIEEVKMKTSVFAKLKRWLDAMPEELKEEEEKKEEKVKDQAADLPLKLKEIKDSIDKWIKDAEEGKLDVSKLPIELKDLPPGKSIVATDENEMGAGGEKEEKEKKEDQKGNEISASDADGDEMAVVKADLDSLKSQIQQLHDIIEKLVESDKGVHEQMEDADEKEKEAEEKEEKEAKETVDRDWQDISHRVEVLSPGTKLRRPTKDYAKTLYEVKIGALEAAIKGEAAELIAPFVRDGKVNRLTKDALDAAFVGASEVVAIRNNSRIQSSNVLTADFKSAETARSINEKNKAFWKKA